MVRRVVPSLRPDRRRGPSRRRLAGPLAAAALVLAACGGDDAREAATTTTAPSSAERSATGSAGATEPAPAPGAADGKVAAADSMMVFQPVEYVFEGDMPVLDGSASAWRWPPGRTPAPEQISTVAATLGARGEVSEQAAEMGGGWVVGAEGEPRLMVATDAQGSWSFMGDTMPLCSDDVAVTSEPADQAPADGPSSVAPPETVACTEPVGIPTADEARATALGLLVALGLDPNGYEVSADSQEWGAWVDARLVVDGIAAPVVTSFGFGAEGALTFASGQLFAPETAGQYERTGTAAALEQLQADQFRSYSPEIDPAATDVAPLPATEPVDADTVDADTPVSSYAEPPSADSGDSTDAPTAIEPAPAAEPVTVHLIGVEAGWWMIWADDGTVWLLPGYDFVTDQGERISAPAVAQIDMPVVETMTGTIEPQPGAGEPPAEPDIAPPLD